MEKNDKSGESDLDKVALEEILQETKRGKDRAETMGPMGWIKCPLLPTNKRFFRNVLMGTLTNQKRDDRMKERKHRKESLPKSSGNLASDSCSSSLQEIERKTNDKYEKSYSSSKYSNEPDVQSAFKDKYKQNIKDNITEKRCSKDRHSGKYDEEKDKKKKYCITGKRYYYSDGKRKHKIIRQSRKHKLEEQKNDKRHHRHVKKKIE